MNLTDQMESNLSVSEIETLFAKIFYKTCEQNKLEANEAKASIEISLSWALKCYDSGRTGRVLLRSLLAGFLILTTSSIIRKYKDLFKLYAINGHMTNEKLAFLLSDVLLLIDTIDEQEMFNGDDIPGTIASLKSLFQNSEDIAERQFIEWLKKEPQLILS
uniref:Uncharacterized protein n=1 Tax=Amphimedon queenslandica TaxID=400682 RepID=A0A1X7TT72_AMPQE